MSEEAKKPFRELTIQQRELIMNESSKDDGDAAVKKVQVRYFLSYMLYLEKNIRC